MNVALYFSARKLLRRAERVIYSCLDPVQGKAARRYVELMELRVLEANRVHKNGLLIELGKLRRNES